MGADETKKMNTPHYDLRQLGTHAYQKKEVGVNESISSLRGESSSMQSF